MIVVCDVSNIHPGHFIQFKTSWHQNKSVNKHIKFCNFLLSAEK